MADHCESYSLSCSKTKRTARSRTSGEYRVDFFMTPSSQEMKSPEKPGRFKDFLEFLERARGGRGHGRKSG
jgi:hypothetical protein